MAAQPQKLRCREPRQGAVPGQRDQPVEADALFDLGTLGARSLVVPEDRRPDDAIGAVERNEPVHLAREPDPGDPSPVELRSQHAEHDLGGVPPVVRILLRPTRVGRRERIAVLGDGGDRTVRRDGDALHARGADIEPDDDDGMLSCHPLHLPPPSAARNVVTASSRPSACESSGSSCSIDSGPS